MRSGLSLVVCLLFATIGLQEVEAQFFLLNPGDGLVNDVSNNGVAVGSFLNNDGQYFSWEIGVGGKVNIGGVPAGNGVGGQAKISNDGMFACGTDFNAGSGFHELSRYDFVTQQWTPLGGLGGSSGSEISSGWGISGDGQSVVGLAWINAGQTHAVRWNNGAVDDLGSTVAGNSSRANCTNEDGSVVAGWQDGAGRQGAVWVDGVQELITDLDGFPAQEASAVSDDGRYVVGFGIGDFFGVGNAYRYDVQNDTYLPLDNLPVGGERNMAGSGITADGQTVVGGTWPFGAPASFGNGYVWQAGKGTMSVEEYLIAKGVKGLPDGFNYNFVSAISPNGQWLVGWGGTGFAANRSWAVRIDTVLIGDVNQDGFVNLLDVSPFVEILATGGFQAEADINQDGSVDLLDVGPFVDLLANGQ